MGAVGVWGLLAEAPARSETLEGPWRPLTEQGAELWATQGGGPACRGQARA